MERDQQYQSIEYIRCCVLIENDSVHVNDKQPKLKSRPGLMHNYCILSPM
jgi:hypothetical protein